MPNVNPLPAGFPREVLPYSAAARSARSSPGIALVSVLFLTLGLIVTASIAFLAAFFDGLSTDNLAGGDDALYVAEAGLAQVQSLLTPAPDFAEVLAWPRGAPPQAPAAPFSSSPRRYSVAVAGGPGGTLLATSEGRSFRGARRRIEATFARAAGFRPVAPLLLADDLATLDVYGAIDADGSDREGERMPRPDIAAESRAEAILARTRGLPGTASAAASGLSDAAARLRLDADRTVVGPHAGGAWGGGSGEVVRMLGDATVDGNLSARGIVVADAPLRVRGRFEVEGLLIATAGVEIEGELLVHGVAWTTDHLSVSSDGTVIAQYSSAALDAAAALRPADLPRAARLGAWRELW